MSEQNRKRKEGRRSRKSKLKLRKCNGVENEELNIVQIISSDDEEPVKKVNYNNGVIKEEKPCSSSTLVELENFDEELEEIERLYNESKINFEMVLNKDDDDEKKLNKEKSYYSGLNIVDTSPIDDAFMELDDGIKLNPEIHKPGMKTQITEAIIIKEIDRIYKESTSEVDKKIYSGIGRYWQRPTDNLQESYSDGINDCINKWRYWQRNSKGRCVPFLFKCYVCKLGWWRLFAFREHVTNHVDLLSIECEFLFNECNLIAFVGPKPELGKVEIFDGSDCPLCGECYEEHFINPSIQFPYPCKYCLLSYTSCEERANHKNQCYKYKTSLYKICKQRCETLSDEYTCPVCKLSCYTERLFNKHMLRHVVWSDVPNIDTFYIRKNNKKNKDRPPDHITVPYKNVSHSYCIYCNLQFKRSFQYLNHNKVYKGKLSCFFCGVVMKKSCVDLLHYCFHSQNYIRVYRCYFCEHVQLSSTLEKAKEHLSKFHPKEKFRKEMDVVIPKNFLDIIELEEEIGPISVIFKKTTYKERVALISGGSLNKSEPNKKSATIPVMSVTKTKIEKKDPELEIDVAENSEILSNSEKTGTEKQIKSENLMSEKQIKSENSKSSVLEPFTQSESILINENEEKPIKVTNLEEGMDSNDLDIDASVCNTENNSEKPENRDASEITIKCSCNFEGTAQEFEEHKVDCYHHQEKDCTKCCRVFYDLDKYLNHFSTDHGLARNTCPQCFKIFFKGDRLNHLNNHIEGMFKGYYIIDNEMLKRLNRCVKCSDVVEKKDVFEHWEGHIIIENAVQVREESSEDENVSINGTVENTLDSGQPLDPRLLELALVRICSRERLSYKSCFICDRELLLNYNWKRHVIEHLLDDACSKPAVDGLQCQICQEKFIQSLHYRNHMLGHSNLTVHKCLICYKTFYSNCSLEKHKKRHNMRVLICDMCDLKFLTKKTLIKHIKHHSESGLKFQCDRCYKIFSSKCYLRRHRHTKHKGEHLWDVHKLRQYKPDCPICELSFRKFFHLKQHLREKHPTFDTRRLQLVRREGYREVEEVDVASGSELRWSRMSQFLPKLERGLKKMPSVSTNED